MSTFGMPDGTGGSTPQDSNNYVEPPRTTGNHMFTDYTEDPEIKQNRYRSFRDRRKN